MHTSGSTGEPKAVMTPHAALANRLVWMHREFGLRPGEAVLHKTPMSFDVAGWELLAPLTTGATVVLARPEGHRDPLLPRPADHPARDHHVPFRAVHARCLPGGTPGGDLRVRTCAAWCAAVRNCRPPSPSASPGSCPEWSCTTCTDPPRRPSRSPPSRSRCRRPGNTRLPIGRPIAGTEVYVLDAAGHLAPPRHPASCTSAGSHPPAATSGNRRSPPRVRPAPLRPRRPALPHRGPRTPPARRQPGVPGPGRPAVQDPRTARGGRRDRNRPRPPPGGPHRRGGGPARTGRPAAPAGLGGDRDRRAAGPRRTARLPG
ncbi:AMP-binding protein [Streptomyces tricolor]|nr:AMP-binding protein [Streptomyces tricolor]